MAILACICVTGEIALNRLEGMECDIGGPTRSRLFATSGLAQQRVFVVSVHPKQL